MKLGRLPARRDYRVPALGKYLRAAQLPPPLPAVPPPDLAWPMDLNDSLGDCTIAAAAHAIQR
jgi:hypothetical protein